MESRLMKNVYFNIVFPFLVAGITNIGIYYLYSEIDMFPTIFNLILSGGCSFLIGILIKNNYKWIIKGEENGTKNL